MNLSNILAAGLICAAGILPLKAVPTQSPAKKAAPAPGQRTSTPILESEIESESTSTSRSISVAPA
jgi:hypothetical protein